jgi:uncharacterized protein YunC (DUF1805 family)
MQIEQIDLGCANAVGLKMDMENAPLLVIRARRGFVMCGYLNMEVANRLGDVAVRVTGVKNFEEVLEARSVEVSDAAKKLGIEVGMIARDALMIMSEPDNPEKVNTNTKMNCWEFKKCGREPGGKNAHLGECPAATFTLADGFCGGKNGGRGCVYITGTYCDHNIQGAHRDKEKSCQICEFYNIVRSESGDQMNIYFFDKYIKENFRNIAPPQET